jgi:hypothetical protein
MPSVAAGFPEEFERRVDEILLVRETYGLMIPPVRAVVMSDEDIQGIQAPTLYILGDSDGQPKTHGLRSNASNRSCPTSRRSSSRARHTMSWSQRPT